METPQQAEYRGYLNTDHWKKKRFEVLSMKGCKCEKCGEWGNEIHHLSYENLWNEPLTDLQVLCDDCHEATHRALRSLNKKDQYTKKKKKIHRCALYKALSKKQKGILIDKFNLLEDEVFAFIRYSNDENHRPIIKYAAFLLGFDGFYPKIVKQVKRGYRPDPYKNKPVRKPMKLI